MGATPPQFGAQAASKVLTDTKSKPVTRRHARPSRSCLAWLHPHNFSAGLMTAFTTLLQQQPNPRIQLHNDRTEAEHHFKAEIKQLVKVLNHEAAIEAERVRADLLAEADRRRQIRQWRRGVVLEEQNEERVRATRSDSSGYGGDDMDELYPQAGLDIEDLEELFPQAGIDIDPAFAAELALIVERIRLDAGEE